MIISGTFYGEIGCFDVPNRHLNRKTIFLLAINFYFWWVHGKSASENQFFLGYGFHVFVDILVPLNGLSIYINGHARKSFAYLAGSGSRKMLLKLLLSECVIILE